MTTEADDDGRDVFLLLMLIRFKKHTHTHNLSCYREMERFDVHRDSEDFPNEGKDLAAKKHYYKNNNVVIFIYFSTVNFNIIKLLLVSLWEFLTFLS